MPGIPEMERSTLTNRIGPLHTGHGITTSSSLLPRRMISSGHVHATRRFTKTSESALDVSRRRKCQCAM
jgi:hypothetical protein